MSLSMTQDVFELVLACPVVDLEGKPMVCPGLVHLWWSAPQQGERLVQVYVNDRLTDWSLYPQQREMWLILPPGRTHRIELLAVPASDPDALHQSHVEQLAGWNPSVNDSVELAVLRDPKLPVDTQVQVMRDGQWVDQGPLWSGDQPRGGFGALMGWGAFGFDDAVGMGLGEGELGLGTLGDDGLAWRWRQEDAPQGEHDWRLRGVDRTGRLVVEEHPVNLPAVESLPSPAVGLRVKNDFTLTWSV